MPIHNYSRHIYQTSCIHSSQNKTKLPQRILYHVVFICQNSESNKLKRVNKLSILLWRRKLVVNFIWLWVDMDDLFWIKGASFSLWSLHSLQNCGKARIREKLDRIRLGKTRWPLFHENRPMLWSKKHALFCAIDVTIPNIRGRKKWPNKKKSLFPLSQHLWRVFVKWQRVKP